MALIGANIKIIDGTPLDIVSVADFNAFAYEDRNRDAIIEELINTAYQVLQRYTGVVFLRSNVELRYINLKRGALLAYNNNAANVVYSNGDEDYSDWFTKNRDVLGIDSNDEVTVSFEAGYSVEDINSYHTWIKTAIKQQVSWMLDHLGDEVMISSLSPMARATVMPYKEIVL